MLNPVWVSSSSSALLGFWTYFYVLNMKIKLNYIYQKIKINNFCNKYGKLIKDFK